MPQSIVLEEFAGRWLEAWAYANQLTLCFIRPGKPIENAYVESLNGTFRDECLNEHWFIGLADAQQQIKAWHVDYNTVRPQSALADDHSRTLPATSKTPNGERSRRTRPEYRWRIAPACRSDLQSQFGPGAIDWFRASLVAPQLAPAVRSARRQFPLGFVGNR